MLLLEKLGRLTDGGSMAVCGKLRSTMGRMIDALFLHAPGRVKGRSPSPMSEGRRNLPSPLSECPPREAVLFPQPAALFFLLSMFLLVISCGPATSGNSSQAAVYSGSAYDLSGSTALVAIGGVPWYANTLDNTIVGLVQAPLYVSNPSPTVTISNPLSISTMYNSASTYDLSGPVAMAVDLSGNLWVVSRKNNSLVELNSCYTISYYTEYGDCGLQGGYQTDIDLPSGVTVDPSSNIWVSNQGNNTLLVLSETTCFLYVNCPSTAYAPYSSFGTIYSSTLYCLSGSSCTHMGTGCILSSPTAITSDGNGNIWVLNTSPASLTKIVGGNVSTCQNFTGSQLSLDNPVALSFDTSGDLVVVNEGSNSSTDPGSVTFMPSGCTPGSCTPVVLSGTSLGIESPVSATFAKNGDLWVAEAGNDSATDIPAACLSGVPCQPIIYEGPAYPFGTPTSILAIGSEIWILGDSALVAITPLSP